jgi:hypothetical protein
MNRDRQQLLMTVAFVVTAAALPVVASDEVKPTDWSQYANAGDANGTIVEADEEGLTLRVSRIDANRTFGRWGRGRVTLKENYEDFDLKYAEGALVRWKKLPPKFDENGKKVNYTPKEIDALRKPVGVPGYAAERTELTNGHIVELKLVRPRTVPAAKATPEDLRIKHVIIVGEAETPPKRARK